MPALLWHPHTPKNANMLESVQCRASRWASNSRWIPSSLCWSKSSDECIQELNWFSFQQCHKYFSICCIHDSLHHRSSLSYSDNFRLSQVPKRCNPLSIWPVTSSINPFQYSFFVNSPFLQNTISHTVLWIKQSPLFHLALCHFLLNAFCVNKVSAYLSLLCLVGICCF